MAKVSQAVKARRSRATAKYSSRRQNRCARCERPRAFMRDFGLCRICFRELAEAGALPGIVKSSW